MTTPMTPNPENPHRAASSAGFEGREFSVRFTAGAVLKFLREDGTWAVPPGGGGGTVWGGITGTLSNQTDLQNALNLKANQSAISTVGFSGAYNDLTGKPTLGTVSPINLNGLTSQFLRGDGVWAIPVDVNATWGNITGTLSAQGDLNTALNAKAPLASPTFTGTPAGPTAAVDTNTTQLATTQWYVNQLGAANPLMNGSASSGASLRASRQDHVHPSDTTKLTNPMTTPADMIYATTGGSPVRLPVGTNGQVLTVVGGVPQWDVGGGGGGGTLGPTFSAYRSSAQSITSGAQTELVFDSEEWDSHSNYNVSNGRFTPNVAGKYQINASISLVTPGTTQLNTQITIYKNGVAIKRGDYTVQPAATNTLGQSVAAVVDMNGTTDFISIYAYSDGTSPTVNGGASNISWFQATMVQAAYGSGGAQGPSFSANRITSNQSFTASTFTEVVFNNELWDTASAFNPANGRFTPLTAGKYQINASVSVQASANDISNFQVTIYKNGVAYKKGAAHLSAAPDSNIYDFSVGAQVDFNGTTDYVSIYVYCAGTTPVVLAGADQSWFDGFMVQPAVGPGDVVGPASATNNTVAIFDGATGKLLKDSGPVYTDLVTMAANAASSGRLLMSAGASKVAIDSGISNTAIALLASPVFTGNPTAPTPSLGDNDTSIATTAFVQQEKIIALTSRSAAYTLVLADANCGSLHPSADTTARIWTIPANGSVAFPIGTTHTFVNQNSAGVITIAITTDTMRLAGAGTTGSRTLAANGIATALKITATEWIINGTGLT